MTDRARIAICVGSAIALGASAYGHAVDISPPAVLGDIWDKSEAILLVLGIIGTFLVYRWWAVLSAIAPTAVTVCLYSFTDSHHRWSDSEWGFSDHPVIYVLFVIAATLIGAAILSLGLLLRGGWEKLSARRSRRAEPFRPARS